MVTGGCGFCTRPAEVEVDVRHQFFWGGYQIKTWTVCSEHRDVLAGRIIRLGVGWSIVAEREV